MGGFTVFFILLGGGSDLWGQLTTQADFKRQVYDYGYSGGVNFNTRGYSLNFRYFKYTDGYNLRGGVFELANIRHPKEVTTTADQFNNYRGYVVGRTNSFFTARLGYFYEKIIFDKTDKGTISINWINSGGLSLGLLKPVYLIVEEVSDENQLMLRTRRYDGGPFPARARGEANFFVGIDELKLKPGLYYKTGVNFDFQSRDDRITALEAGLMYDYFFGDVPIFHEEQGQNINWSGFFQMYVSIHYGYKKN